jgi:histidine triad (HIT) family protein
MATIFSKIIAGEIPSYKVAENDKFLAFLDITPVAMGHTLVIPKVEVDYFFDMNSDLLAEINLFAKEVATKIQRVVPCKKIGVSVVGLEVPHAHMHLIPLNTIKDMSFTGERLKLTPEEFETLAKKIREA